MRLPRDLSGDDLIQGLYGLGYQLTRQTGSHIRLTRETPEGAQHVTIPRHKALRLGTLNGILTAVSGHLDLPKDELVRRLLK
jgi:predicted RNA binding protein YcfA (HicA-like mRNA interferase family)